MSKDVKSDPVPSERFTSQAFPTAEDMALWDSLDAATQRAIVIRDEQEGFDSGVAPTETLEERLARVRAELVHAL